MDLGPRSKHPEKFLFQDKQPNYIIIQTMNKQEMKITKAKNIQNHEGYSKDTSCISEKIYTFIVTLILPITLNSNSLRLLHIFIGCDLENFAALKS